MDFVSFLKRESYFEGEKSQEELGALSYSVLECFKQKKDAILVLSNYILSYYGLDQLVEVQQKQVKEFNDKLKKSITRGSLKGFDGDNLKFQIYGEVANFVLTDFCK